MSAYIMDAARLTDPVRIAGSGRFTGKVALITGGGSGIGRATALAFAREGATVVVAGRAQKPLDEAVELIEEVGGQGSGIEVELTREDDVARLMETIAARYGGLDIAFNNAGILGTPGPVAEIAEADWNAVLASNLTSIWLSMKYEIAQMRARGGGVIINMASNLGAHMVLPGMGAYAASKAAVSALTRTAARECIGEGIRINSLSPGAVDTPMSRLPGETDADRDERMKTGSPIGRVGSTAEIAATVLWLASPESGYAVGLDLVVDGGASA
jgi:NAD(P)-dependent dehydrogenase (short-subunit alcohol dehydrogenase family)